MISFFDITFSFSSCSVAESSHKNVEEQKEELLKVWLLHFAPHLNLLCHMHHILTTSCSACMH